jgi:hypothetical protein
MNINTTPTKTVTYPGYLLTINFDDKYEDIHINDETSSDPLFISKLKTVINTLNNLRDKSYNNYFNSIEYFSLFLMEDFYIDNFEAMIDNYDCLTPIMKKLNISNFDIGSLTKIRNYILSTYNPLEINIQHQYDDCNIMNHNSCDLYYQKIIDNTLYTYEVN